ncbi:MAG: restriction endonuclease subunit S, partial [Daejeonella sp.]
WEVKKARNIGDFNGSTVDKKIDESQKKVRLVNFLDVYNNPKFEIREKKFMVVSAKDDQINKFRVNIGDVVFTPSSEIREDIGRSAVIKYEANDLVHSYHVVRLKFRQELNIDFKKYLFNNYFVLKYFSKVCTGSTRKILTRQNFNNIELVIPPLSEQTAIANFLDYKTAKIDRFIFKKKQLIKLLNEQKAGIINDAVTKGLNPNAKTKPSGIEWLGDIPEHWEVRKLKYVAEVLRGKFTPRPRNDPKYYDGQYPFVQTGNVATSDKYIETYSQTLNEFGYEVSKEFPVNSIVMTIAANIADVAILKFNACFPDSIIGFKPFDNIDVEFLYYQLKNLRSHFFKIAIKSTQYNLNVERVQSVFIILPPIQEQKAIVSHIEKETAIINKTITTIEKEIALVQEYRTAIIAEAVTGKIDVREYSLNYDSNDLMNTIIEDSEEFEDSDGLMESLTNDSEN